MFADLAFWLALGIALGFILEWVRVKMLSLVLVAETELALRDMR